MTSHHLLVDVPLPERHTYAYRLITWMWQRQHNTAKISLISDALSMALHVCVQFDFAICKINICNSHRHKFLVVVEGKFEGAVVELPDGEPMR